MTVKTDPSKSGTTSNPTKSAMKQNRKSLSERFNEYAKEAKLKKTQDEEALEQEEKTREVAPSNKNQVVNLKPLATAPSTSVATTVTSLRAKTTKNPVFTIQLPSRKPSLKNNTSSNAGAPPTTSVNAGNQHVASTSTKVSIKPKTVTVVPGSLGHYIECSCLFSIRLRLWLFNYPLKLN